MAPRVSRRRKTNRRRKAMKKRMPNEYAKVCETHEFAMLNTNTAYFDYSTSLARCERASTVGRGFQEYKVTKVEYEFIPLTDTFLPGTVARPQLYFRVDKTASLQDFTTVAQLVQTGCKPKNLDEKIVKVAFKPAVLQLARDASNGTNPWAKPLISPWLSTNKNNNVSSPTWAASSIDHYGLAWFVEQLVLSGSTPPTVQYTIRQRVHFEFRKPIVLTPITGGVAAIQAPSLNSPEAEA